MEGEWLHISLFCLFLPKFAFANFFKSSFQNDSRSIFHKFVKKERKQQRQIQTKWKKGEKVEQHEERWRKNHRFIHTISSAMKWSCCPWRFKNSREDVYLLKSVKMICTQFACRTGWRKTTVILTNPDTIEIYRRNHIAVRKVASNETDPSEKFSLPICFEILLHILSTLFRLTNLFYIF